MKRAEWRNQQMAKKTHKRRYISGIDGLRTLAVIGVIVFHLAPSALQGGVLRGGSNFLSISWLFGNLLYVVGLGQ
ncbi:hypothetical protein [Lentilactobacillus senioris]|uniref:hypothetical protein n=1 Tax=Lentilactobacillus senioris TaxID=931534 RepID=UPI000AAB1BBF|nr:hypothetical protein [Lentilactobacillus senioris]